MASKITYDDLVHNDRFVASAYRSLVALGETPSKKPKEIVDDFLTKKRYFENNLVTTLGVAGSVKTMSPQQKNEFGAALSMVEQIPNFHEEGGAPGFDAVKDHLVSALADPTNLLGAFAGMASFGVGGAAVLGAKETAKQTTKNYLKAKMRAAIAPAILESTVTGAGASFRNIKKQHTEIEIGNRTNIDVSEAALVGLIEGPASVLAGGALSTSLGLGIRSLDKTVGDTAAAKWLVNNMLPRSVGKLFEVRIAEQHAAVAKQYTVKAQGIGDKLERALIRSVDNGEFTNIKEARNFANKILVPDKKEMQKAGFKAWEGQDTFTPWYNIKRLKEAPISSELRESLGYAQNFIKEVQEHAQATPYLKTKFANIFNAEQNYARDIYEVFSVSKRSQSYNAFIKETLAEGTDVTADLLIHARANPAWIGRIVEDLKLTTMKINGKNRLVNQRTLTEGLNGPDGIKWADSLSRKMYEPAQGRGFRLQGNVDEARKAIPEFQQLIWGKNYSPSQRVIWSVAGILDSVGRLKFGAELANSLLSRNKAVKAKTRAEAHAKLNAEAQAAGKSEGILESDVIRVVGSKGNDGGTLIVTKNADGSTTTARGAEQYDALVEVSPNRMTSAGENVWMTRAEAQRLEPAVSPFLDIKRWDLAGTKTSKVFAQLQGTFKVGKTVYNPLAHMRNALGAAQAFVGSGAWVRTREELLAVSKMSKAERAQLIEDMQRTGITSTSVELEQILTRLGRDITEDPGIIEKVGTFGLAGTKVGKAAMKLYQGTDNVAKMATYLSELGAEKALWKTLTDEQKFIKIKALNHGFGRGKRGEGAGARVTQGRTLRQEGFQDQWNQGRSGSFTEAQAIAELASQKTLDIMPVYSRVPLILEKMAAVPVVGNFSAYPAEVYRNAWNIFRLGAREMEEGYALGNKSLIAKGGTRMASVYGLAAAPFVASHTMNALQGDEQRVESLREFVPEWDKYGALIITNFDPKAYTVEYRTLDYSNPYQPLTSIVGPVMQGIAAGESAEDLLKEHGLTAAKSFVSPFTDSSLVLQGAQALINLAEGMSDETYESAKDLRTLYRSALPGFVKQSVDTVHAAGGIPEAMERILYPKAFGEHRQPPKDISELASILEEQGYNAGALKTHKINLKTSSGYALHHLNRNANVYWNSFSNTLRESLSDPNIKLDPQSLLQDYEEALRVQYAAQQGVTKLYIDLTNILGKGAARKIFFNRDLRGVTPSKKALYSLTSDQPRTSLKRLSRNKDFWKRVQRSPGKPNINAWRKELERVENKYDRKNVFEDPIE